MKMSGMGVKIEQFELPVCNSFQAIILNDQLCYEVDLSRFSDKDNIDRELKLGFNFIMDYNEDRQIMFDIVSKTKELGIASSIVNSNMEKHALIYLNTIGKHKKNRMLKVCKMYIIFLRNYCLYFRGVYHGSRRRIQS